MVFIKKAQYIFDDVRVEPSAKQTEYKQILKWTN